MYIYMYIHSFPPLPPNGNYLKVTMAGNMHVFAPLNIKANRRGIRLLIAVGDWAEKGGGHGPLVILRLRLFKPGL